MNNHIKPSILFVAVAAFLPVWGCASSDLGKAPTPRSLEGTDPDGALRVAEDGRFMADEDALQFFDYVLTTEGEVSDHELHAMVRREATRQLPAEMVTDVEAAFAAYIAYREEAAALLGELGGASTGRAVAAAEPARSTTLPAEIEARLIMLHARTVALLPGIAADWPRLRRALALRAVATMASDDRADTGETRNQAVLRIDNEMTPAGDTLARARVRRASRRVLDLAADTRALTRRGAGDDVRHAFRVNRVGAEAAERLAALDRQRAEWLRRVEHYRVARDEILASSAGREARDQALGALLRDRFDHREQLRIRALERAGRLGAM